jgi:hypothetical protein
VAPITTGTTIHCMFDIRCISVHKLLYFSFFSAFFCVTFLSAGIATSNSMHIFSYLFLIIISGLFALTSLSVCTPWFHNPVTSSCSHTGACVCVCVCVCTIYPSFRCPVLCILSNVNAHHLYRVSLSVHSSPGWGTLKLGGQQFLPAVYTTAIYYQIISPKFYF